MKIITRLFPYFCFAGVLYAVLCLSGCAAIFGSSRMVTITTQQDSTTVTIIPSRFRGNDHTRTVEMHGTVGRVKMKSRTQYYEIKQERPGYFTKSTDANINTFNAWKLVDIGIPLVCDLYVVSGAGSTQVPDGYGGTTTQESNIYPFALYMGTLGWIDIFFGYWQTFPGKYDLPALVKVPSARVASKMDSLKKVYVKNVSINISKDSMMQVYYKSQKDYDNHKIIKKENLGESFNVRHTVFRDSMNDCLMRWNYIDTTKGFFSFVYKSACYIRCNINGITINTIGNSTEFDVRSEWKLYGVTGDKEIYGTTLTGISDVQNFYVSEYTINNMMAQALTNSLTQFLALDTVSKCLTSSTANMKALNDWDTIRVGGDSGRANNLTSAVKAVVTVKTPEGHGSGCIISSDGYLVTNYHVIAEDTSDEVKIINSDGDSLKAKYVRSNTSYDLALFKIEKPKKYGFFSPNLSTEISVGTEVYAIGTPEDIELGQTMTKGIISSKRKVGDRTLIQTDVSINPGNSGGGLVDSKGVLQGIVNASLIRYGVQGIGFAIPAHYIQDALKVKFMQ
jgi:serine protease Do